MATTSVARGSWRWTARRWWRGSGALPTTLAGAEICVLVAFLGLRATDLVQLAVAAPQGLGRATRPGLDLALMLLYLIESVVVATVVVRARRFRSTLWATVDVGVAVVVLVCEPFFVDRSDLVGTWTAWGFAISVGAAFAAGIAYPHRWQTWTAALVLAGVYVVGSRAGGAPDGELSTVLSNTVGYFGFALFPRALAGFLRRLGEAADGERARAEVAATRAERDRQRHLLHDHATVLRMLAEPALDPALATLLRQQAMTGADRVRHFLQDTTDVVGGRPPDLASAVTGVCAEFGDLPLVVTTELAVGVEVDADVGAAVSSALSTVLHNVRSHARATTVVVHADADADSFEVTVRDDGVGFNPQVTPRGFGLREQVFGQLTAVGVDVDVDTAPGEGTAATLRGPRRERR